MTYSSGMAGRIFATAQDNERAVMRLIARGYSVDQIIKFTGLSRSTVVDVWAQARRKR